MAETARPLLPLKFTDDGVAGVRTGPALGSAREIGQVGRELAFHRALE